MPTQPARLSDLAPDERNPRIISPEHLEALKHSLTSFGDISGIVWNRRTGHLVAGHQRVRGLQETHGDLTIEGDEIVTPDGQRFRLRVVEWDEATERAANVAANSPSLMGTFTDDLNLLLAEIGESTPELFDALMLSELDVLNGINLDSPTVVTDGAVPDEEHRAFTFSLPLEKALVVDRVFAKIRGGKREKTISDDDLFVKLCLLAEHELEAK